jgi:MFS transporter, ACS family, hexuronate transporter
VLVDSHRSSRKKGCMSSDSLDPVEAVEAVAIPPVREAAAAGFGLRWVICGLLFFATTINYVDRVTMSVMESTLKEQFQWTPLAWSLINVGFLSAYAIGSLYAGWMIDKLGTRLGFAIALTVWSVMAALHALARGPWGFVAARFGLGIGESGNFPASIKTTAEWFPKKERALATGVFNSGSNVGNIVAAALVPWIVIQFGWQTAFIATGLAGLVWVAFWWPLYRSPEEHPWVSRQELAYIQSDPADPPEKISWKRLVPFRQTWAFAIGKFLTDSIWWFYVFWFAKFMHETFPDMDIKNIGWPMATVYIMATVGSVIGGWQSSWLLGRGWSTNAARKIAMISCAVFVVPVAVAPRVANPWTAVALIGLATAAHQGFSCNLFTLASDMFPRRAVGSVVGLGTFAGATGGVIVQLYAGFVLEWTHGDYLPIFVVAGAAYLAAVLAIHLLVPRIEPVEL